MLVEGSPGDDDIACTHEHGSVTEKFENRIRIHTKTPDPTGSGSATLYASIGLFDLLTLYYAEKTIFNWSSKIKEKCYHSYFSILVSVYLLEVPQPARAIAYTTSLGCNLFMALTVIYNFVADM